MKKTNNSRKPASKGKRILALGGVILLAAMYILTLVFAFLDSSDTMIMFKITILTTVLVPVLLWAYTLIYKVVGSQSEEIRFENESEDDEAES